MTRPLLLFTQEYPYGIVENFLDAELPHLVDKFHSVVIIPGIASGKKRPVPPGVVVEEGFSKTYLGRKWYHKFGKLVRALKCKGIFEEILKFEKKLRYLQYLFGYASEVVRVNKWTHDYLKQHPQYQEAILYTYWCHNYTAGLVRLKSQFPKISVCSRAHRYDLYEEEEFPYRIPFREETLPLLNALFPVSNHGTLYLQNKYNHLKINCLTSKIGAADPTFTINPSDCPPFRLVSCSRLVPIKRVSLMVKSLALFAHQYPHIPLIWRHLGDGREREVVEKLAYQTLPPSIDWKIEGHVPSNEIYCYYEKYQPHLFLNLSESEGIPASLMEAQACGIPIMATDVGGVSELMNGDVGFLLEKDVTEERVVERLYHYFMMEPELKNRMSRSSRENWKNHFDESQNHRSFVEELSTII